MNAFTLFLVAALHLAWWVVALLFVARQQRNPTVALAWIFAIGCVPVVATLLYLLIGWRRPCGFEPQPVPTYRNRIRLLHNGGDAFAALIAALQQASGSIHLEYYIFRGDRIGRTIAALLVRKARSGVSVRLIYDAVGSWSLGRRTVRQLRAAGVEVRVHSPLRFPWFCPSATRRNHRKIVIVDGRVAFIGGINIAGYYLEGNTLGRWRDEHLSVEGEAVGELQRLFARDWERTGGRAFDVERHIARVRLRDRLVLRVIPAGEGATRCMIGDAFSELLLSARRCVRITTPYFVPTPQILDALRIVVRRGVEVRLLVSERSDSRFVDRVAESFLHEVSAWGVCVRRYTRGFLHSKLLIVDTREASVGTANLDYRSLEDNLEVAVFLHDSAAVEELRQGFDADFDTSPDFVPPTPAGRLAGDMLRLTAPLL